MILFFCPMRASSANQISIQAVSTPFSCAILSRREKNFFVTTQVLGRYQAARRLFARSTGSRRRASMMFHPCFLAVDRNPRIVAKSSAPSGDRKPPEIFMRSFIMRTSRSASLLLKGTPGSRRKRSVSLRRVRKRKSRLCPVRRGARPRVLPPRFAMACASGGCLS